MVRGIPAGQAFVEIIADTKKLEKGLKTAQARLKSFGESATKIGLQLTGLGTALSVPFLLGAKAFADFETTLLRIDVLLGDNTKSLEEFKREIETLAIKFGVSKETLVSGLEDILQASIDSAKAIDVLVAAVKLSKIGFTEVGIAADALTTIINAYGKNADEASKISDQLFQIVRQGKISFEDLANNIGNVATIAATAGVSFEELGGAISVLTRNGIKAEEAITSLRALMITFLKPQDDAAKLAKTFGLELTQQSLASDGLFKSLKKLEGLPADVLARIFPNVRALKGVLPLLKDLNGFGKDITGISNSAGNVNIQFIKVTKTLNFMFSQINQIGRQALEAIGASLRNDIERLGKVITRLALAFQTIILKNQDLIPTLRKVAFGVIGVGITFIALGSTLLGVAVIFGTITAAFTAFISTIALIFSPLGVMIVLITTLAVVVVRQFDLINKAANFLGESFEKLKDRFGDTLKDILNAIEAGDIRGAFRILSAALNLIWVKAIADLERAWLDFKTFLTTQASEAFFTVFEIVNTVATAIESRWSEMINDLLLGFESLKTLTANFFDELTSTVAKIIIEVEATDDDLARQIIGSIDEETARNVKARKDALVDRKRSIRLAAKEDQKQIERNAALRDKLAERTFIDIAKGIPLEISEAEKKAQLNLEKARNELTKAVNETKANQKKQAEETDDTTTDSGNQFDDIARQLKEAQDLLTGLDLKDLGKRLTQPGGAKLEVIGSFSGQEISLQANLNANKSLKAQEETAKNTKDILRNQRDNTGAVFA